MGIPLPGRIIIEYPPCKEKHPVVLRAKREAERMRIELLDYRAGGLPPMLPCQEAISRLEIRKYINEDLFNRLKETYLLRAHRGW